jgi:CRP/FNR family transcriptional regulator, cyclic AMP receptor protein
MSEVYQSLTKVNLLSGLDDPTLKSLEQRCRWQRFGPQEQIIGHDSDSRDVYFIVEGRVRVVNYSLSGREITFDEIASGRYFGEFSALDGHPRSANVVALTETLVASVSPETFLNLLRDNPGLAVEVMQELAKLIRASRDRVMDLSTLGAHNRVHSELLREAKLHARDDNTAVIAPIPVHGDIASRVSTTRETVARVFGDLTKQGLIKRGKNELLVLDLERLEKLVENLREI